MDSEGRKILLGVTGGIAAYKIPQVARLLMNSGAEVRVVMTESAEQFVTASTLAVLTRHCVYKDLFDRSDEFPVLHVGLGKWADLVLIAPATANIVGKIANGIADDLLSSLLITTAAPVLLAPAMEEGMLHNPHVDRNIRALRDDGVGWIEPDIGELASGDYGKGRMASPEEIATRVEQVLNEQGDPNGSRGDDLRGLNILITAGPTCEDLDPVRFITNRSSGKMGYAIAAQAVRRGAQVTLISGPTALQPPSGVRVIHVRSAEEMLNAARQSFEKVQVAIMAAAVSDYRVAKYSDEKIKGNANKLTLELVQNIDIAADLGRKKGTRIVISFAMETQEGVAMAKAKLTKKKSDLVALNNLCDEGAGFAVDTNVLTLVDVNGGEEALPKMSKTAVGDVLLDRARELVNRQQVK